MWPFSRKKPPAPRASPAPPPPPPETELARLQREVFERVVNRAVGPPGLDDCRLELYAARFERRTHDALLEAVPHTARVLGPDFPAVARRYVAQVPSTHHCLARLGHGFAEWLRNNLEGRRVDLADLAELELARGEAAVADDCAPVEVEAAQQLGPERFAAAWLQFVPSLRVLELSHRVLPLWQALQAGAEPPSPEPGPEHLVVWRRGFEVAQLAVVAAEHAAMVAATGRETIAQVCRRFAGPLDAAAPAPVAGWVSQGMVAALREPAPQDTMGL